MVNTQEQNLRKCPGLSQAITSHSSENWNKPQYSKDAATLPRLKQAAAKYRTTSAMPDQCASDHSKETGVSGDRACLSFIVCWLATSAQFGQHVGNMKFNREEKAEK